MPVSANGQNARSQVRRKTPFLLFLVGVVPFDFARESASGIPLALLIDSNSSPSPRTTSRKAATACRASLRLALKPQFLFSRQRSRKDKGESSER